MILYRKGIKDGDIDFDIDRSVIDKIEWETEDEYMLAVSPMKDIRTLVSDVIKAANEQLQLELKSPDFSLYKEDEYLLVISDSGTFDKSYYFIEICL